MKMYKKTENVFIIISIIVTITLIIIYKNNLNNKLIEGIMISFLTSSIIISFQSYINYKVERSNEIIPHLKEIKSSLYKLLYISENSIEMNVYMNPKSIHHIEETIMTIRTNLNTICDIYILERKIKKEISELNTLFLDFEEKTHLLILYFKGSSSEEKSYIYIELLKIINEYNFKEMINLIYDIGVRIDAYKFYYNSQKVTNNKYLKKLELKASKEIYLKNIKEKNKIEYEVLKNHFEFNNKRSRHEKNTKKMSSK